MSLVAAFVMLVMCFAMIAVLGVGIGLGLFAAAVGAMLAGLGIISSSVALGFLTRRPAAAMRAFLLQCGVLAGIPVGAVTAWVGHEVINSIATWQGWSAGNWEWKIPLFGAVGGALAGLILALLMDYVLRKTHAWVESRRGLTSAV